MGRVSWMTGGTLLGSITAALLIGQVLPEAAPPPPVAAEPLGQVIEGELGRRMDRVVSAAATRGYSGQVLVAVGGDPVLHRAYGFADPAGRRAMELDTPVGIASISKQFAAAAILEMDVRGRLSLADTLPLFFEDVPEDKRSITLRALVSHRSGLRSRYQEDFEPGSVEALVQGILETPLAFSPGERWQYSAAGYNLLARVLEQVTGQAYEDAVRELILEPAGMRSTGFLSRLPDTRSAVAPAYLGWDDRGSPARWPRNWRNFGAGDMVSTAGDLFLWERALREGTVLSRAARERFFAPLEPAGENTFYGFGLFFHERPPDPSLIEHGGDAALGFNGSFYRYVDEDFLVLITATARTPEGEFLRHALGEDLETLARGGEVELPAATRLPTPAEIDRLSGSYRTTAGARFHVLTDGAHLWLAAGDPAASAFLGAHGPDESADLALAVEKAEALLSGLMAEDSTAYRIALTDDGAEHLPDYLGEWRGLVESRGPFFGFSVLGAQPIGGDILTRSRLRFAEGRVTMTHFWRDRGHGRLGGTFVGGSDFWPTTALALAPLAEGGSRDGAAVFAGRDPVRGTDVVEVRVRSGPEGQSLTLVLRTKEAETEATKVAAAGWVPPLR